MSATPPVVVIRGADEVLVRELVSSTVARLVGDGDHAMMVDDLMLPTRETTLGDEVPEVADVVGAAISAASTPPFLTERRVVVVRGCALLSTKEDVASLVQYLTDPLPTTSLLLVWDLPHGSKVTRRSAPPKSLLEAVEACGGMVDGVDPAKKVAEWVKTRLGAEAIRFDAGAVDLLVRRVGDNPEVLVGYLTAIRGRYQPGDRVTAADLEPLLVEEGGVPPWDLTDAIEAGDPALAVHALQRMLGPGARHPLQVMASLTGYVTNLLTLDGSGVATAEQARSVLGGSLYVAKKAFAQGRRLGSDRVAELVRLVAEADLDLRGRRRLPDHLVMEILVARMASRSAPTRRRGAPATAGGSRRR